MELNEFCKQYKRMCDFYGGFCKERSCPLFEIKKNDRHNNCLLCCFEHPEEAEIIIRKWVDEHPIITNRMKFKEVFGYDIPENIAMSIICNMRMDWNEEYHNYSLESEEK